MLIVDNILHNVVMQFHNLKLQAEEGGFVCDIIISAFDLVTIVVPPALPVAMTIGIIYAQSRLAKQNIYCINSLFINVSGVINFTCFDKVTSL